MLCFRKPSSDAVQQFLESQQHAEFSYSAVGATRDTPPSGYVVDRTRVQIGNGEGTFNAARGALERWEQFRLGWVEPWPGETPIQCGEIVAVVAHAAGLWWLNACRIVSVVNEENTSVSRFGFAYGTLADHVESGEERFLVEWNRADDAVWYDILAFSRPRHVLARLAYPWARRLQKRFARDSAAAMRQALSE
ncbi:MAG: DUF1990 domain-containing protein [Planctomycetes bacterium]|nr:DUF1990 domain-containing protein [Planctomycetota bacterium]